MFWIRLNTPILINCLLFISLIAAQDVNEFIGQGDSLLAIYDYKQAAESYQKAADLDSGAGEAYWKMASSLNQYAELLPREEQLAYYERAESAAKRAIELDSTNAQAHFQLARAVGKIALFKGVFKSVGLAKQVKREAEIAIKLDSTCDGAYHILGRWNREVAQKPKFIRAPMGLGSADKKRGLLLFAKAIELNPTNVHHRLEYGISLFDIGKREEARQQFEICIGLPAQGPLDLKYQSEAKENLAELDKKH